MIKFNPLWKTLIDRNLNKMALQRLINCSSSTITKMGKNEYVSMDIIERICKTLECRIEDIIEYEEEK